jgi:outer membrane protein OmpA-like peptidoglycan-associated protein
MSVRPTLAAALLALAGCAQTGVLLFPGETDPVTGMQNPTGGVAVLDPRNGSDISVIDQANSRSGVRNGHVTVKAMSAQQLESRYGALLTDLVDESNALLPDLFGEVKARPGVDIQIVGHTDTVGQEADNDALSIQRAGEVKVMLAKLGIAGDIIRATGRGERELRDPTADETPSALNRRVEVFVK